VSQRFPATAALISFQQTFLKRSDWAPRVEWIQHLEDCFTEQGLEDVKVFYYEVARRYWRAWSETALCGFDEYAVKVGNEKFETLVRGVGAELERGAVLASPFPKVVVGRKPR
jgi:hypothetical protein